jgi:hypothetical protein
MISDVKPMIDPDFVKRCNEWAPPFAEELQKIHQEKKLKQIQRWNDSNRVYLRQKQKEYILTEKGKIAVQKASRNRLTRMKALMQELTWQERKAIRHFYKSCPEGYEVDHIIPVCKGGKHTLENLQYLKPIDNRKKAYKILPLNSND